ncbi:uncharacterized protein METZ01_LOCUS226098, partial [marine metagenome]
QANERETSEWHRPPMPAPHEHDTHQVLVGTEQSLHRSDKEATTHRRPR